MQCAVVHWLVKEVFTSFGCSASWSYQMRHSEMCCCLLLSEYYIKSAPTFISERTQKICLT